MRKPFYLLLLASLFFIMSFVSAFAIDLASPDRFHLNAEFVRGHSHNLPYPLSTGSPTLRFNESRLYNIYAQADDYNEDSWEEEESLDYLEEEDRIADPFEPVNRVFFALNDKLYFWILKPVAQGYSFVFPEPVRRSISNFFSNLTTPVRFVNNLLQLKLKHAGNELLRFGINTGVGLLGLFDVAKEQAGIQMQDEDLGQTFGTWGLGPGFYINWPVLGPSSLRDAIGSAGDYFLDPVNYVNPLIDRYAIKATDTVNKTSFRIGDYEEIKKDALDPYAAVKDIYHQYRKSKVSR